jgi:hypothetical protein
VRGGKVRKVTEKLGACQRVRLNRNRFLLAAVSLADAIGIESLSSAGSEV